MTSPHSQLYLDSLQDGHIRVLQWSEIQDSSNPGLSFQMRHMPLDTPILYFALSYRWQDPLPNSDTSLTCDGVEVNIGPSLRDALVRIYARPERVTACIWVDYICINQSDEVEKQAQILRMPEIYSKAQHVIIWLGEGTEETDNAVKHLLFMVTIFEAVDESKNSAENKQLTTDQVDAYKMICKLIDAAPNPMLENIWKFLNLEWWGRIWTVQEAALAAQPQCLMLCGSQMFSYSLLYNLTKKSALRDSGSDHWVKLVDAIRPVYIGIDPERPPKPILVHGRAVLKMQEALDPSKQPQKRQRSYIRFLHMCRMLDCIDPRDRIFTAAPLFSQTLVDSIRMRQPISVEDLYILFASHHLAAEKNLRCLSAAGLCYHRRGEPEKYQDHATTKSLQLPSWVPDWTCPKTNEHMWVLDDDYLDNGGQHLFQPTGDREPAVIVVPSSSPPAIAIKGTIIDTILDCTAPYKVYRLPAGFKPSEKPEIVLDMLTGTMDQVNSAMSLCIQHRSTSSPLNRAIHEHAVRRTLTGDILPAITNTGSHSVWIRSQPDTIDLVFQSMAQGIAEVRKECERFNAQPSPNRPETATDEERQAEAARVQRMREVPNLLTCLATAYKGRRFFVTEHRKLIGIGPRILQPGDQICVFFGTCTPFVIRPWRNASSGGVSGSASIGGGVSEAQCEDTRFELVGECYIDDMMDGQVLDMDGLETQDILLV